MPKSLEEVAAAYRSEPWWYDVRGFFIFKLAYRSTFFSQLRLFGANMGPRHLEAACGTGTLLGWFLRWRRWKGLPKVHIVGVDYAESMLAGAIHRFRGQDGFEFLHADVANMPFPESSFDTVNIANSVHSFPDVNGCLRGVFRVLKPGGTMAVNTLLFPRGPFPGIAESINRWGKRKGILNTPYEPDDIRQRILNAGFEILSESVRGNCFDVRARKPVA